MEGFASWRPVALARQLKDRPLAVRIESRELVLFRSRSGAIGAIDDRCPHRGMRLSRGRVDGDRLTCPYHGWSFCPAGSSRSPSVPSLQLRVLAFETAEKYGLVWLRSPGSAEPLPEHDEEGLSFVHSTIRTIRAPVASVLDNFTEVEHTGVSHWQFGYDPERMPEIRIETAVSDSDVRVRTEGPQRPLWSPTRFVFGIGEGMELVCEWRTSFEPLRSVWSWHWRDPLTGRRRGRRFKAIAYFNAVQPGLTQLVTFYYWSPARGGRWGLDALLRPLVRAATNRELARDIRLVEGLDGAGAGIAPTRASRFDEALCEQRRRLAASVGEVRPHG